MLFLFENERKTKDREPHVKPTKEKLMHRKRRGKEKKVSSQSQTKKQRK